MDHYREIKPVLNKLSKYNVYDSLDVISIYLRAIIAQKERSTIQDIEAPEYYAIELYFADFLIVNAIIYCSETKGELSLRKQNDRYRIFKPVAELNDEVHKMQSEKEPLVCFVSYMFNQINMNLPGNALVSIYRYLYLYDAESIKNVMQKKMGISLDYYFRAALYVYCSFRNGHIHYKEKDLLNTKFRNADYIPAIRRVLNDISLELTDLRHLCKDYCSYESDKIFNYYNDAPHVRFPLIRCFDGYCCIVPDYIMAALLDGLYYALEIPNHPDIRQEFATNFENYVGMLLEIALDDSNISFCREITYKAGRQGSQKTSDWILRDSDSICFLDCKLKRISIAGKRAIEVDDNLIKQIIDSQPFSGKNKHDVIESLEEGLTKDLILLGMDLGKIYACFEDYKQGIIPGLEYDTDKKQYACLVTLEDGYINTPEYKKRIVQIAQSYCEFKTGRHNIINEKDVLLLSVNQLERSLEMMADMGVSKCLDNSPILDLQGHRKIADSLMERFAERIYYPFMPDIIHD
ncbi:MAG: hypothetical protein IKR72_02495 [Bacteroidales bacterium]|nr:hypothetical protein [Bacteroidales bacterium]